MVRINKRQRRDYREQAKKWSARADAAAPDDPEKAAMFRSIAENYKKIGNPRNRERAGNVPAETSSANGKQAKSS